MPPSDCDFILIVDDNPTNLAVLSQALKSAGLKVRAAEDGESAIALVLSHAPALILLDVQMPGIDGFETCRQLKADAQTSNVPIIFMTALADTENKVKGLSAGAVDYITKPFEASEVIARVNVHLQLRQLHRELSTKNAQLANFNATLEQQVHIRTEALRQAQTQIVQQEKLSALGELVAGIAHEINNPIGCIVNNVNPAQTYITDIIQAVQIYRESTPNLTPAILNRLEDLDLDFALEDLPKLLNSIQMSGNRIRDISLSLRNFARSDSHTPQPINIHEGLDGTLLILGHRLKAVSTRPAIVIQRHYGDIPAVKCYPGQLNQVFMNLLANAIDALEEAIDAGQMLTPSISIHTAIADGQVIIRIADNGPGIPAAIQPNLFDPMFTTKPVGKGTGLGLSISRQIINDTHQGQLSLNPEVTLGAEFVIALPL
jgi:signal transduction histidine kinase